MVNYFTKLHYNDRFLSLLLITAYLDWLLTCLTYLIGQCKWENHKNLLVSLGNTLMELIISFHGAGTVSFMGLSITRNSIICLNHLLRQMQIIFSKSVSIFNIINNIYLFITICKLLSLINSIAV